VSSDLDSRVEVLETQVRLLSGSVFLTLVLVLALLVVGAW
jgi:hypothetical protein